MQEVPAEIQPYWDFFKGITIEDGLLLNGTRIIIPTSQRQHLIKQLHAGHLRLTRCFQRAKQTIYWPELYDEFHELQTNCQTC